MNEENTVPNIWNDIARRALRTGAHIPVVEEEFNREKALAGIAWNFDRNRRPKPAVIQSFRKIIENKSFASGSALRIARNASGEWVLIDGQHRLNAIADENARMWMMVIIDERPANVAYANIDNVGTLRNYSDAISSALGWSTPNWLSVVGAARIIACRFEKAEFFPGGKLRSLQYDDTIKVLTSMRDDITRLLNLVGGSKSKTHTRGPQLSVFLVAAKYAPETFYPWFERATEDDLLARDSTEKRLVETFLWPAHKNEERYRLSMTTALIWNAHFRNESMPSIPRVLIAGDRLTKWPGILGTPYAK